MKIEADLTPEEQRLVKCAASGDWWEPLLSPPLRSDFDPAQSDVWEETHNIRAIVLRHLCTGELWPGSKQPWPVDRKGIQINGALIIDELDLESCTIPHALWLHQCAFKSKIKLLDAVTRTVSLAASHLDDELDAQRAKITGSLRLIDGFHSLKGVKLVGATITGQLNCSKGHLENVTPDGRSLNANSVTVDGAVFLSDGFQSDGEVNLVRATIKSELVCNRGTFLCPEGLAINANGISVAASVLLGRGFVAHGEVEFTGAKIIGQLGCDGGNFENPRGISLNADSIEVTHDVYLRKGFCSKGVVNFVGSKIGGDLRCRLATFLNPGGDAIDLSLAKITDGLFIKHLVGGLTGRLVLTNTICRTFSDDPDCWPEPGQLALDGFVYTRFDDCPVDWKSRLRWLQLQERSASIAQPWKQVISVLREMGHDHDAWELAYERENARTRSPDTPRLVKLWLHLQRATMGYGYKPQYLVYWSALFIFVGWFVFATAAQEGYMAPRDSNVRVSSAWNLHMKLPRTYPEYNALVFALDAYLPVIEFGQDEAWEPTTQKTISASRGDPTSAFMARLRPLPEGFFAYGWHRIVYWVDEILGWLFVSVLIGGLSTLLKRE